MKELNLTTVETFIFPPKNKINHYKKNVIDKNRSVLLFFEYNGYAVFQKVWQTHFGVTHSPLRLLPYKAIQRRQFSVSNAEYQILKKESLATSNQKYIYNSYIRKCDSFDLAIAIHENKI